MIIILYYSVFKKWGNLLLKGIDFFPFLWVFVSTVKTGYNPWDPKKVAVVHWFDCTVKPVLTSTSAKQPPVNIDQHDPQDTRINTVKPVYNNHPWDPKIVAVVDRWPLFRGGLYYKNWNWAFKIMVFVGRWVAVIQRWPLAQVWLY
jgi:hypothetical protein